MLLRPVLLALLALPLPSLAQDVGLTDTQKKEVQEIVRQLLTEQEPELIIKGAQAAETKAQRDQEMAAQAALSDAEVQKALYESAGSPTGGNTQGDMTVVEFYDYQCGFCKAAHTEAKTVKENDANVRFVYKQLPILGPASLTAAKAVLAANMQGKFSALHEALMTEKERLSDEKIFALAQQAGLDIDRLKADMEKPEVGQEIANNMMLAEKLGIRGTPGFVIGDQLAFGMLKSADMAARIQAARDAKKNG